MRLPRYTGRLAAAALLSTGLLTACDDHTPTAPESQPTPPPAERSAPLGLVEITIEGIGSGKMSASAAPADGTEANLNLTPVDNSGGTGDGTIQLEPLATGTFTEGERGSGGVRYVYASFRVRNAQQDGTAYDTPRQNLTFLGVDTNGTYGHTAVSHLGRFDGNEPADTLSLAPEVIPTGKVHRVLNEVRASRPDVVQFLSEAEADAFTVPATVADVFPYGFMVQSPDVTTGSRTLPASPAAGQFDGVVTFAFKLPLQASSAEDPFSIRMVFLPVDDSETRVSQSAEEQYAEARALFEQRAADLGASLVTVLPDGSYTGGIPMRTLCSVRVAGPASNPTTIIGVDCSLFTWTGASSSTWASNSNWDPATIPTSLNPVLIPAGTPNEPVLGTDATISELTIQGGSLTISGQTLTIRGM